MIAAIAPRYSMLRASEAAKVRVLRSRDRLAEDETARTPSGLRSLLPQHPRAVLAGSLALAAAVVAAAVLLFRPPVEEVRPYLAAANVDGGVEFWFDVDSAAAPGPRQSLFSDSGRA